MYNWEVWRFIPTKQRCSCAKQRKKKKKSVLHVQFVFMLIRSIDLDAIFIALPVKHYMI